MDASVFNMSDFTVTKSVAACYTDDVKVPIKSSVATGCINDTDFLAMTAGFGEDKHEGIDQTIIMNGDKLTEIYGNQYEKVHEDRSTHLRRKEELKVDDVRMVEIWKDDSLKIQANQFIEVKQNIETTITGGFMQTVINPMIVNDVSSLFEFKGVEVLEIAIARNTICAEKAELAVFIAEVGVWMKECELIEHKMKAIQNMQSFVAITLDILWPNFAAMAAIEGGPFFHGKVPPHKGA
jgi:hypothetical protein